MRHIFISYKRADETTLIAEEFRKKILVNLTAYGFAEPFLDRHSIEAGDPWLETIDAALAITTDFIALLSDDYRLSEQCQRELRIAVDRYQNGGSPRLLFILTERMDARALTMSVGEASASTPFPKVENLGQINFLGPRDSAGRLIRLSSDKVILKDQLFLLMQDIRDADPQSRAVAP